MPEHPNVQRIRDAYVAFAAGDLANAAEGSGAQCGVPLQRIRT